MYVCLFVCIIQIAVDETAEMLRHVAVQSTGSGVSPNDLKNLKRRNLVEVKTRKSYRLEKGADFNPIRKKRHADLSKDMLGNKDAVGACRCLGGMCVLIYLFFLSSFVTR